MKDVSYYGDGFVYVNIPRNEKFRDLIQDKNKNNQDTGKYFHFLITAFSLLFPGIRGSKWYAI